MLMLILILMIDLKFNIIRSNINNKIVNVNIDFDNRLMFMF